MEFGVFLSSEECGPRALVDQAVAAETAGFDRAWISDHFHPWIDEQGHSPFVWSVIGAIAEATDLRITTGVTCPTIRTHPAIIAHAAATSACLLEGRFQLGVGSGENLNEHVHGDPWPDADIRQDMLEEAIEVMRLLWQGGVQKHDGPHYQLRNARLYDLPDEPVPVIVSAFGPKAAELAGRIGDGLASTSPDEEAVKIFTDKAGTDKPRQAGVKVCWGPDEDAARKEVLRLWPNTGLPGELAQELPSPAHFEQAVELVTEEHVGKVPCGPDPEPFVETIQAYADAGFTELFFHQVGGDLEGFSRFFRAKVEPAFAR
jgi:G6PDH family F420-dependent oxidoreductase